MQMDDGWQDHLHFSLLGEHVLFPHLHLDSIPHFLLASLMTISLCFFERALTFAISRNWNPVSPFRQSRLQRALWKTVMYWLVTLGRLLYMLIAMTFNAWLILVTVTSLSIGQFIIAYLEEPHIEHRSRRDLENLKEPLLESPLSYDPGYPLNSYPTFPTSPSPIFDSYPDHYPHSPGSSPSTDYESNTPTKTFPISITMMSPDTAQSPTPHQGYSPPRHPRLSDSPPHPPLHALTSHTNTTTTHLERISSSPSPSRSPVPSHPPELGQYQTTRPRSRSKPKAIFIHPTNSNLARADAVAQELGLGGDTELVKGVPHPPGANWQLGKGRDLARELMGAALRKSTI